MKALIVCTSQSHGNTRKLADAMGQVLEARVVTPEETDAATLAGWDMVGFGSGVFYGKLHPDLLHFARALPPGRYGRAFTFATSGLPELRLRPFARPITRLLEDKGFEVSAHFSCRALDTWGPFKLVGGVNRQRPDAADLEAVREFARGLVVASGRLTGGLGEPRSRGTS